jgi:trk system potassium uptake protein TrkH
VLTLITAAFGYDVYTAFSSAIAVTSTVGFGFGPIAGPRGSYGDMPALLKLIYSLVMIAGRLELAAVFVIFTRSWREAQK